MTQHASGPPTPPTSGSEPSYAERVKTLLVNEKLGTMATQSVRHPGWPFASVMPYVLTDNGSPAVLISSMAIHTKNALADPHASLLVMQTGPGSDSLASARATLLGLLRRVDTPSAALRAAYLDRHHGAKQWIDFSDFSFFQLEVSSVYYVGGFGVMGWVDAVDYVAAEPDPLASSAARIIDHMNSDHADSVLAITRHFGSIPAEDAAMVSCDRLGFVVRASTPEGTRVVRIPFAEPVASSADARRVLVGMSRGAK